FFFRISKTAVRDFIDMAARRRRFEQFARPGDIVISPGAAWGVPDYAKHMAAAKARYAIRLAILVHDMIPIENGALVEGQHAVQFRRWLEETLPRADTILTISNYSRRALLDFAAVAGWTLPRVDVVRLGEGFSRRPIAVGQKKTR